MLHASNTVFCLLFLLVRMQFLAEGDPDMDKEVAYTAMVEYIPTDKRSSPALYEYFDNLFPGKVTTSCSCLLTCY